MACQRAVCSAPGPAEGLPPSNNGSLRTWEIAISAPGAGLMRTSLLKQAHQHDRGMQTTLRSLAAFATPAGQAHWQPGGLAGPPPSLLLVVAPSRTRPPQFRRLCSRPDARELQQPRPGSPPLANLDLRRRAQPGFHCAGKQPQPPWWPEAPVAPRNSAAPCLVGLSRGSFCRREPNAEGSLATPSRQRP
jgi:hypothetical protein